MNPRRQVLALGTHAEFLMDLEHVLEKEGFDTTTTWDAREALALLVSRHFDVLLVSDHPPEVKAAEFLKRLRSEQRIPCILVLAADARFPFEAQYLCSLGAQAVVPKWKPKRIVEAIRQSTASRVTGEQSRASA